MATPITCSSAYVERVRWFCITIHTNIIYETLPRTTLIVVIIIVIIKIVDAGVPITSIAIVAGPVTCTLACIVAILRKNRATLATSVDCILTESTVRILGVIVSITVINCFSRVTKYFASISYPIWIKIVER